MIRANLSRPHVFISHGDGRVANKLLDVSRTIPAINIPLISRFPRNSTSTNALTRRTLDNGKLRRLLVHLERVFEVRVAHATIRKIAKAGASAMRILIVRLRDGRSFEKLHIKIGDTKR
jgi:hypothetical protein